MTGVYRATNDFGGLGLDVKEDDVFLVLQKSDRLITMRGKTYETYLVLCKETYTESLPEYFIIKNGEKLT